MNRETSRPGVVIVGCGPGSPQYLTVAAQRAAARADVLFGSRRLLALFPECTGERIDTDANVPVILAAIAERVARAQCVVVLVSGDPGLFSLAQPVLREFGPEQCVVIPAVSSVQVAFSRLGLSWGDAEIISAHGRTPPHAAGDLMAAAKLAILAGTSDAIRWCAWAADLLRGTHVAFLLENLTLDDERIQQVTPETLAIIDASPLSIVIFVRKELF
jgi:precorrin-6y C5,15-methyltransferase (decarboxylating) CbiE subunit